MKYVIDKKKNIEKVYLMSIRCELCMTEFSELAPNDECSECPNFTRGCHNYKEISTGKIGMSFLEFISPDFERIKKELVELFYKVCDKEYSDAYRELENYLDGKNVYLKLLDIYSVFCNHISRKDDMAPFETVESDIDVIFENIEILQKIISAYADDRFFVDPYSLLQALNEYQLTFCPSTYTPPDWGNDFVSLKRDPIKAIKDFEAACKVYRGECYEFTRFWDSFGVALEWIIDKNHRISRCENCGKFFVPYGKYTSRYCPYPNKNGKSCRELSFEISVNNNRVLNEYRKIYKTKHAWMYRNKADRPVIETEFNKWHKNAKAMVDKYKHGAVSELECLKWLEDNK